MPTSGSSPLTRGKHAPGGCACVRDRLIPAHAGKTRWHAVSRIPTAAHPRSRGENHAPGGCSRVRDGSSPLTRGKLADRGIPIWKYRLIPAHAGKTWRRRAWRRPAPAHPRSRGENWFWDCMNTMGGGSSPLTRGKRRVRDTRDRRARLIPAHAGKTPSNHSTRKPKPAHPRSRGENKNRAASAAPTSGSSPLTRGKHFLTCAFIAQIDQILESLELCASSESYSLRDAYATDVLQDQVRSIGLAPLSSRGAS